jgi:hypothetical protein
MSRGPRCAKPSVKADFEADFADCLQAWGWQVLTYADVAHGAPIGMRTVVRQHMPFPEDPVSGKVREYRLDFAHPLSKVYCELDGYVRYGRTIGGHNTWGGFHSDREKDRILVWNGWRPIRFGTGDLKDGGYVDAVRLFVHLIAKISGEKP